MLGTVARIAIAHQSIKSYRSLFGMAWRSSGSSNEALIGNLFRNGLITSEVVKRAMLEVDRAHYAPAHPYDDSPQTIGYSATISAPHMHANAAEALLPFLEPSTTSQSPGGGGGGGGVVSRTILDVGSGSGYLTAVLAGIAGPEGRVVGIDHIEPLVALARANMGKSEEGRRMLEGGRVAFVCGDGRKGWPEAGPYDAIHVGAAAAEAHDALIAQLKAPGRLFIPVGEPGEAQFIWVIDKDADGKVSRRREYGVMYVPLTDAPGVRKVEL